MDPQRTLEIRAWPDAVIDRLGHDPTSPYFEWLWLPRLGPSCSWGYRRLTSGLVGRPDGYSIDIDELAHWLGLGRGTGRNSPVVRTLRRLVMFNLATQVDDATLAIRRRVPPLTQPQLGRLSPGLQRTHLRLVAGSATARIATAS